MTTKNGLLFLKDKYQTFANDSNKYSNFNLNQNNTSLIFIPVQSCSKRYSERFCDSALSNDYYEAKGRIKSSDKSSNLCLTSLKFNDETRVEKHWKKNESSNTNSSTLSLRISPYENPNKASSDSFDEMSNDGLKKEKSGTISKREIMKQIPIVSTFINENPFEFPRQQNDRITKPEVSQFKAFQRLLNPNKASKNHQETSSINNDALDALKGAFGKAKQKILKIDFSTIAGTNQSREDLRETSPNYAYFEEEEQTVGIHRSLKSIFISDRDKCVNSVAVDTNNIIIRLDKLINDCPDETSHFEKETVPWAADNTSACQSCSAKFYLTRRKHHCRLCGNVICTDCSKFLPFAVAQKLTNPAFTSFTEITSFKKSSTGLQKFADSNVKKQTTKFLSSLGIEASKFGIEQSASAEEQSLRVCSKCKKLLERRQEAMDQMSMPSVFVDMYEKLCQLITQVSNLSPSYKRMAASLKNGESMYTLEAAIQLRKKLGSLQHEIQNLSERIEKWGLQGDPLAQKPTPRELILRGNIRYSAIAALQEYVLDMPELPSKEEYEKLKEKHKEKVRRQVEEEKEINGIRSFPSNPVLKRDRSISPKRTERRKPLKTSSSFSSLQNEGGWTPEPSNSAFHYNPFVEDEPEINPVQQQYIIIKHYLKQAAESGRVEELEMLEKNLKDIEDELKRLNLSTPRTD